MENRRIKEDEVNTQIYAPRRRNSHQIFHKSGALLKRVIGSKSVPKVASSSHVHCEAMRIAVIDAQLIFDRTPRLDNRGNSSIISKLHTIGKWEESIGSHHGTIQLKSETSRLHHGLLESVHSTRLSGSASTELLILGKYNGIGTGMFCQFHGKQKVAQFRLGRRSR